MPIFTRLRSDDFASSVIFSNGEIFGGIVSWIVTVWEAIAIFPAPSTAVQIIVLIPKGNEEGALLEREDIPLSSVAKASPIFTSVNGPVACTNTSSGTKMVGFWKSLGIGVTGGRVSDSVESELSSSSTVCSSTTGNCVEGVTNFCIRCPWVSVT